MPKIKCLECPHEIFYSAKGGEIRCVKCKSSYGWDGEELTLLLSGKVIAETEAKVQNLELNKEAEEAKKRIEYFKLTGDDSKLFLADIRSLSADIVLTTGYTVANRDIDFEIDIITAECVYGLHLFKDMFASIRDTFGGRSKALQDALRDARKTVLAELRREAFHTKADAVIGVDLDYQEISGGGKGMLMLVANGTAVRLKQ